MSDPNWRWRRFTLTINRAVTVEELSKLAEKIFHLKPAQITKLEFPFDPQAVNPDEMARVYVDLYNPSWYGLSFVVDKSLVNESISRENMELEIARIVSFDLNAAVVTNLPEAEWSCGYWLLVKSDGQIFLAEEDEDFNKMINVSTLKPWTPNAN